VDHIIISHDNGIGIDASLSRLQGWVGRIARQSPSLLNTKALLVNSGDVNLSVQEIEADVAYDTLGSTADLALFLNRLRAGTQDPTAAGTVSVTTA